MANDKKTRSKKYGSGKNYKGVYYSYFKDLEKNAKNRNIPFNITLNQIGDLWENQNICPYSGLLLVQRKSQKDNNYTASLDRIDSSKGYQPKNVQWVWKEINYMKGKKSDSEFKKILKVIVENGIRKLYSEIKAK